MIVFIADYSGLLRKIREAELTLAELAEAVKISVKSLYRIKSSHLKPSSKQPSMATMGRLAVFFQCTLDELVSIIPIR